MPEADKKRGAVEIRQEKQKEVLIEELHKRPIVQGACQKVGIGRASYYRWRKDDPVFAQAVDEAMETGIGIVNDVAETQLMTAIREGNMSAVIFWLRHHHATYRNKLDVSALVRHDDALTDEEAAVVNRALELVRSGSGDTD
jgi:hypothetical protein